jgi:hypothetical protein
MPGDPNKIVDLDVGNSSLFDVATAGRCGHVLFVSMDQCAREESTAAAAAESDGSTVRASLSCGD